MLATSGEQPERYMQWRVHAMERYMHWSDTCNVSMRYKLDNLCDFLRATGAIHANTFEKAWDKKVTWKPPATQGFAPPWNPERFAELDICIVRDRWNNTVTNVQSDIRTNIDSDHIALHVNMRQKLKKLEEDTPDNSLKGIKRIGTNGDTSDVVLVKYLETANVYLKE